MGSRVSKQEIKDKEVELSQNLRSLLDPQYYDAFPKPEKGDWQYSNQENGQMVSQYMNCKYMPVNQDKNIIYLVNLSIDNSYLDQSQIGIMTEYIKIYFQLSVIWLDPIDINNIECNIRINDGIKQYCTKDILVNLIDISLEDAYCILAITTEDLYPSKRYNYVFGESSLDKRVGVFSVKRLSSEFMLSLFQDKDTDDPEFINFLDLVEKDTLLNRSLKLISHEILHMFDMGHCISYNCVLCGINNLFELDRWTYTMCPICISKFYIVSQFDVKKREEELIDFYQKYDIPSEYERHTKMLKAMNE